MVSGMDLGQVGLPTGHGSFFLTVDMRKFSHILMKTTLLGFLHN